MLDDRCSVLRRRVDQNRADAHSRDLKRTLTPTVHYLIFDLSDDAHGVSTLEAMASTSAAQHAAVMAEVQQVLEWAWRSFPHTHGSLDDGMDWDHDLQLSVEEGGWHAVTLTMTGSARFVDEFLAVFHEE